MILYPNKYLNNVQEITIEFLQRNRIKALILDVDNTLIDYNKHLKKDIINWAKDLKGQGIKLYILSNTNDREKVEKVANKLDIPYEFFAKKPLKKGFMKIQRILKEDFNRIAVVGDQIFTDIIGGNRCGMYTILVEPIDKIDYWYTSWKRPIENLIKKRYTLNLNKGEK